MGAAGSVFPVTDSEESKMAQPPGLSENRSGSDLMHTLILQTLPKDSENPKPRAIVSVDGKYEGVMSVSKISQLLRQIEVNEEPPFSVPPLDLPIKQDPISTLRMSQTSRPPTRKVVKYLFTRQLQLRRQVNQGGLEKNRGRKTPHRSSKQNTIALAYYNNKVLAWRVCYSTGSHLFFSCFV
jgi:hypothetical protein